VSIKNGPYKDTGYNWHNKTHDENTSKEQIDDNNDVCSICLHDMKSAKITLCNHLYHEMCLRKWISTKTDCPLCKEKITITNRT
jgi:hypothetical protein